MNTKFKKKYLYMLVIILLFLILAGSIFMFSFFDRMNQYDINDEFIEILINGESNKNVELESGKVAMLDFIGGNNIDLQFNSLNFGIDDASSKSKIISQVKLIAGKTMINPIIDYNIYFHIDENTFEYSTPDKNPEILLIIKDPEGKEITTIPSLNYVEVTTKLEDNNGNLVDTTIKGFDITTKEGLYIIDEDYIIESISREEWTVQNWTAEVIFVNLPTDQSINAGKKLTSNFILQRDDMSGNDIEFPSSTLTFKETIIKDNGGYDYLNALASPNFSKLPLSDDVFNNFSSYYPVTEIIDIFNNNSSSGSGNVIPPEAAAMLPILLEYGFSSENGLYTLKDDYGTSYYYRGAVENNWVYFAGFYWKIIRVNGDDSVRLIYAGKNPPTSSEKVSKIGVDNWINEEGSMFNDDLSFKESVGYMYEIGNDHGYSESSTMKNDLDAWYKDNLVNYDNYIHDTVYCNDRNIILEGVLENGSGTSIGPIPPEFIDKFGEINFGVYSALTRNYLFAIGINSTPSLECSNISDAFTVNDTINGNGALTYPIGAITLDEMLLAGYVPFLNRVNYLNSGIMYWPMSPVAHTNILEELYNELINNKMFFDILGANPSEETLNESGIIEEILELEIWDKYNLRPLIESFNHDGMLDNINEHGFNYIINNTTLTEFFETFLGTRAVISLKPSTRVSGSGTWNDPYIIL